MNQDLAPVVVATTDWLLAAFSTGRDPWGTELARVQARQAVTVAAWLRYPTDIDCGLLGIVGPGGSERLDWAVGSDDSTDAWRTWVDEVLASWAACLLADEHLAVAAVAAAARTPRAADEPWNMSRLTRPDAADRVAATLLRHPDLTAGVADLHREELLALLHSELAAEAH